MARTVTVSDFRYNLGEYMNQIVYRGETLLIKRRGKVVAQVAPYTEPSKPPAPGQDTRR